MGTESSWQSDRSTHNNGLVDQAKGAVSEVAEAAREKVGAQIGTQKGRVAEQIGEVAQALRDTGARLGENEQSAFAASYVDKAASQIDRMADYVEARDVGDIVREVQDLARREPAAFFGGLFALGLVAGRFLKSSSPAATGPSSSGPNRGWQASSSPSWPQGGGARREAIPRPEAQAKPDVIPPAAIREVGTESGNTGAQAAPTSSAASTTTPGLSPKNNREPRGGSGSGAS